MQLYQTVLTLLATVLVVQAAPTNPNTTNYFPTACDKYACGWCHYFYDKDTVWAREKSTSLPDGTAAEKCLNDITGRWVEPCTFCKAQPYCQGDCIPH